ncbi:MAG: thiamine phosphate synthase [Acidobacteriaceae bacterium]|nr:thiamine phosphate synthase [Acidobacteriaceae bacterium]
MRIVCDTLCSGRKSRTRLVINSRADVAIACGADGVHLRSDDISVNNVRRRWISSARDQPPVVGVSCHTIGEVARAASESADFAVFAPVFEKKDIPQIVGLEVLSNASRQNLPVFALGGVNLENSRSCIEAGAAGIAGIRLFQEREIAGTVEFLRAIDVTASPTKFR